MKISDRKKWSWGALLFIILLAAFTATLFQEPIQEWVHAKMDRDVIVKITRIEDGRELPVRIKDNLAYYEQYKNTPGVAQVKRRYIQTFEELKNSIVENKGFRIVEAAESEYEFAYLESVTPDASIVFSLPYRKETVLTFFSGEACSVIQIQVDSSTKYAEPTLLYNPESANGALSETRVYPFEHNSFKRVYLCYIVVYALVVAVFFAVYTLLYFLIIYSDKKNKLLFRYNRWWIFALIFAVQAVMLCLIYNSPDTKFKVSGMADAFYYSNPPAFDESGMFSFETWVGNAWTHRGFISQIVSLIRNAIAGWMGINPIYLFYIEISLMMAFVCAIVLPRLYHLLTGRQPYNLQSLLFGLILNVYYGFYFFYTLCDLQAAFFALCGICWFFSGLKKGRLRDLFIAGAMLSLATNYRATYKTLIFILAAVLVLVPVGNKLWSKWKKREEGMPAFALAHLSKKCAYGLLVVIAGVLLAAVPQYAVTYLGSGEGHLFPYSSATGMDYTNLSPRNQLAGNVYGAMSTYYYIHTPFKDQQMVNFTQTVYTAKTYTMEDIIYCCMNRPLDFLNIYLKKIFYAFSPQIYDPYGINAVWAGGVTVPLTRLLIIWIQGSLIYSVFKKEGRKRLYNKPTFWISLLILLTSGAIGALMNLEWRYLLLAHILIFFLMAFYIVDGYLEDKKYPEKRLFGVQYFVFMGLYCWTAMTALMTIITNFL